MSTALQLRRRSQLLGTPVFVERAVERLGFVSQVWVDVHTLRVVGWSIRCDRSSASTNSPPSVAVALSASKLLGTGALLLNEDALSTPLNTDAYVRLIPQILTTETGVSLGRLKDFTFDMASGAIASVRTSGTGIPLLPPAVDSTFEIPRTDLISGDSLTAADGAEERLTLLKRGLLEQAGIGKFNWALPLSAGEPPAPDETTLEAIAEAAAAPLAVETTSAEPTISTSAGAETAKDSEASHSDATSEDADTGESAPTSGRIADEKPLDRAIDALTSTIQPLLQKLPSALRQQLGLSDTEPEEEASRSDSASTADDAEEVADPNEDIEGSVQPDVTVSSTESSEEDTAESSEPDTAEPSMDSSSEVSGDRTEDMEAEEPEPDISPESSLDEDSVDEDVVAIAPAPSEPEPLPEEEDLEEEPEEQSESVEPITQEAEDETQLEVDAASEDEDSAEHEQPSATAEAEAPTSDASDESLEDTAAIHEDVESPSDNEPSHAEMEAVESDGSGEETQASDETQTSENAQTSEDAQTIDQAQAITEASVAPASMAVANGISSSQSAIESVNPSPPQVAPAAAASPPSDDTVPPALQTSLPRVPRSTSQSSIAPSQSKPGTPLQSFVSLPKPKGRVPKSGGSFEPKVKGS